MTYGSIPAAISFNYELKSLEIVINARALLLKVAIQESSLEAFTYRVKSHAKVGVIKVNYNNVFQEIQN
jgi:hypothetical protein